MLAPAHLQGTPLKFTVVLLVPPPPSTCGGQLLQNRNLKGGKTTPFPCPVVVKAGARDGILAPPLPPWLHDL